MVGDFHTISQKIDRIYTAIGSDIKEFKNKDPQDVDYSYYFSDLKEIFQYILKSNRRRLLADKKIRLLFFAFAIEIFNCENFQSSFWETLFSETDTDVSIRTTCFDSLMETSQDLGIKIRISESGKRLVVYSIKGKAIRDITIWKLLGNFFLDYFKCHRNETVENYFRVFSRNVNYLPFLNEREHVIQYVEHATILFAQLIGDNIDNTDEETVRLFLNNEGLSLGPFRDKKITSIIRILSNRVTPIEFQKVMNESLNYNIITPETEQIPVRLLLKSKIDFGIYSLASINYQITPNHRIGLYEMIKWESDKIVDYKGITFFKKHSPFEVTRQIVRRFIFNGNLFYVWCGHLSIGNGLNIENNFYRREGFAWDPKLKMTYGSEFNPPTITIETGNVSYYDKTEVGKRLQLLIGEIIIGEDITDLEGFSSRPFVHTIACTDKEINIRARLDGKEIQNKKIFLMDHILFSNNSREQIKGQTENMHTISKKFGESKYTLFSKYDPELIETHMQITNGRIFTYNQSFLDYFIFEIHWTEESEFKLVIDSFSWNFQYKKELHLFFNNQIDKFSDFKEFDLIIDITIPSSGEGPTYELFDKNYRSISDPIELDQSQFFNGIYHLTGVEIIENSVGNYLEPGEYFIEIAFGDLSNRIQFFIIPKIDYHWPTILPENQPISLEFTTPEKCFFDVKTGNATNVFSVNITGKISEIRLEDSLSIIPEKSDINIPLTIPKVLYKIEKPAIPIFGYRLLERIGKSSKDHPKFIIVQEGNYYDLLNSSLLLFSRPGEIISIIHNDKKILIPQLNTEGQKLLPDLSSLADYCSEYITEFSIRSVDGYQKQFSVFWNPRVFGLSASLISSNGLSLKLSILNNGPIKSKIRIKISSSECDISEFTIDCIGQKVLSKRVIPLGQFSSSKIFNIQSFVYTFNSEWVPSKQVSLPNESVFTVTVKTGEKFLLSKEIQYHQFIHEIFSDNFSKKIITHPFPVLIELSTNIETTNLMQKILLFFSEGFNDLHFCVIGKTELSQVLRNTQSTDNNEKIHFIDPSNENVEKTFRDILTPYSLRQLAKTGLGVSSDQIKDNIEDLIPKIRHCMIFEAQELNMAILDQIIKENSETKFVLVKRSVK